MYHNDDNNWKDEEIEDLLTSRWPKDFHKVMAAHYAERLQQVIKKGLQYTRQHFFLRDSMDHYKKNKQ